MPNTFREVLHQVLQKYSATLEQWHITEYCVYENIPPGVNPFDLRRWDFVDFSRDRLWEGINLVRRRLHGRARLTQKIFFKRRMKDLQQLSDDNQLKPLIMQLGVKESNWLDLSILKDLDGQIHYDREKINYSQISKHFDKNGIELRQSKTC
jgi:hypothetical protein